MTKHVPPIIDTRPIIRVETSISCMAAGIELIAGHGFIFSYGSQLYEMVTYHPFMLRRLRAADVRLILAKHARWERPVHCNCEPWCEYRRPIRPP